MSTCAQVLSLLFAGIATSITIAPFDARAQDYPTKPVRVIVGYSPGGGTDTTARVLAQKLTVTLGQTVLVENRPGASGAIAIERVAGSPPDGYTMLMLTSNETVLPAMRDKLPFDLERDFAPVSLVTIGPMILVVHPAVPARNVKELVALARAQPGKLSFGSSGMGGTPHLAGELFGSMAGAKLMHVAYKGGSDAVIAAASGQVDMSFASITSALAVLAVGKLRGLAVTSAKRMSTVADIPTLNESGVPGYDYSAWYGIAAPAGTPRAIVTRLNADIGKVVNTSAMKESLNKQGLEPQTNKADEFAAFIRSEIARSAKLIRSTAAKAQ
jgi:tripartite-type tricarboxylate transporter receptor subunit TctC